MIAVDWWHNSDGTWTARIFSREYTANTEQEVKDWLRSQGEFV